MDKRMSENLAAKGKTFQYPCLTAYPGANRTDVLRQIRGIVTIHVTVRTEYERSA